ALHFLIHQRLRLRNIVSRMPALQIQPQKIVEHRRCATAINLSEQRLEIPPLLDVNRVYLEHCVATFETARAAVIFNPDTAPYYRLYMRSIEAAAPSFAVKTFEAPVRSRVEIEAAMSKMVCRSAAYR